jgi:hypothetical protein
MCVVTQTSAEPPSHLSCGEYAAVACPFLAQPNMRRNEKDLPEGHQPPAGVAVMRNPGVTAVLITDEWTPFSDGSGGILIRMGEPLSVEWFAHRRPATFPEVAQSIQTGMPLLLDQCDKEITPELRQEARRELYQRVVATAANMPPIAASDVPLLEAMKEMKDIRAGGGLPT